MQEKRIETMKQAGPRRTALSGRSLVFYNQDRTRLLLRIWSTEPLRVVSNH